MELFTFTTSTPEAYEDYCIYEYDNKGIITFNQHQNGPRNHDYLHDFEGVGSIYRVIFEEDGNNTIFEGLNIGDVLDLDSSGSPIGVLSHTPLPTIGDVYLHITLTDGDGKLPIGIKNDGIDTVNVFATFRQTEDPTSPVITAIDNVEWRVTIREVTIREVTDTNYIPGMPISTTGPVYDIVNIIFIQGVLNFNYMTTNKAAICNIIEEDFEILTMGENQFKMNIVGDTTFKVFRQFI